MEHSLSYDPSHKSSCAHDTLPRYNVNQSLDEMSFERGIWAAALEGDVDRLNMLLKKGISVDTPDSAGYTALHYATRNGHLRVCEILLEHGANVNSCTRSMKTTPLHRAAWMCHVEIIDLLLRHGADPNMTDEDGKTALHRVIATAAGTTEGDVIIKKLQPITDRAVKDNYGQTVDDLYERWRTTGSAAGKPPDKCL